MNGGIILLSIWIAVTYSSPSIAFRNFPENIKSTEILRDRIGMNAFIKFDIPKRSKKYDLPHGTPADPTDELIDAIPPYDRLSVLDRIRKFDFTYSRLKLHKSLDSGSLNFFEEIYMRYLLGIDYLEAGVLAAFLHAVYIPPTTAIEREPMTCVDLVKSIRQSFHKKYDYSLDHVTPRVIHDWYQVLATKSLFRVNIADEYVPRGTATAIPIPPLELVNLEPQPWREILKSRSHRLKLTGYENIDL